MPMSVRPIRDIEEDVFRKMIEPFDPTQTEVEQWVAGRERESENLEENLDGDEAVQPKTKPPPTNAALKRSRNTWSPTYRSEIGARIA